MEKFLKSIRPAKDGVLALVQIAVILVVVFLGYTAYLYFNSPGVIRNPYLQHYHFRLQTIVDGKSESFALPNAQTEESSTSCDAALPLAPVHFHDQKDQIVHIHWDGMTGGLFLKDYGWNYMGGLKDVMGYRFDSLPHLKKVPIHGNVLPAVSAGDQFYVYSGDAGSYKARSFDDFINQDLEIFFHHPSNLQSSKPPVGLLNLVFPKAYAQKTLTNQELTQLNNLIGNVVIFAQKNRPSDAQIAERFAHLAPLSTSVCGS